MSKNKKCGCKWKKPLIVLLVLAICAFIGWLVYYFFFADDYEDLDDTLFAEKKEEEPAEEVTENAEAEALDAAAEENPAEA